MRTRSQFIVAYFTGLIHSEILRQLPTPQIVGGKFKNIKQREQKIERIEAPVVVTPEPEKKDDSLPIGLVGA